jgi:hypothetical protein
MEKLLREGWKMRADKAFVFALEGYQAALNRRCEEESKQNEIPVVDLWPSSWGSSASSHM